MGVEAVGSLGDQIYEFHVMGFVGERTNEQIDAEGWALTHGVHGHWLQVAAHMVEHRSGDEEDVHAGTRAEPLVKKNCSMTARPCGARLAVKPPTGSVPPSLWGKSVENAYISAGPPRPT